MIKILKDWKFVFIFTFFCIYLLVFASLFQEEMKLPSDGWSRGKMIGEIKGNRVSDMLNENVECIPIPEENLFLSLRYLDNDIYYNKVDAKGTILSEEVLNIDISSISKVKATRNGESIDLYLHNVGDKKLYKITFNWKSSEIEDKKEINDEVLDFKVTDNLLVYKGKDFIKLLDGTREKIVEKMDVKKFSIIKRENVYHIPLVETEEWRNSLKYIVYDPNKDELEEYSIGKLKGVTQTSVSFLGIEIVEREVNIITVLHTPGSSESYTYIYRFPKDNPLMVKESDFILNSISPTPTLYKNDNNQLLFVSAISVPTKINPNSVNIIEYTIDKGNIIEEKLLSKMRRVSINPKYFELAGNYYVHWTHVSGKEKQIMFASTDKDIIKKSVNPQSWEIVDIAMTTVTRFLPTTYIMLIPMVFIAAPVVALMLLLSIFKLSWMEHNQNMVLKGALIIHILMKLIYTKIYIVDNQVAFPLLPGYLQSFLPRFGIITLLTVVSLYSLRDYMIKRENKHFINYYTFFLVIDVILFAYSFMPYFY